MRKILSFVCLMTTMVLGSCTYVYTATANYDVCYPDGTRTYEKSALVYSSSKNVQVITHSVMGTNFVAVMKKPQYGDSVVTQKKPIGIIESSTAPIRLNSYKLNFIKKK